MESFLQPNDYDDLESINVEPKENLTQEEYTTIKKSIFKLNIFQRAKIRIFGYTYIKKIQLKNWKKALPIYAFYCKIHGIQLGYPIGWKKLLMCPICFKELSY
jgi:hypothetical protein